MNDELMSSPLQTLEPEPGNASSGATPNRLESAEARAELDELKTRARELAGKVAQAERSLEAAQADELAGRPYARHAVANARHQLSMFQSSLTQIRAEVRGREQVLQTD